RVTSGRSAGSDPCCAAVGYKPGALLPATRWVDTGGRHQRLLATRVFGTLGARDVTADLAARPTGWLASRRPNRRAAFHSCTGELLFLGRGAGVLRCLVRGCADRLARLEASRRGSARRSRRLDPGECRWTPDALLLCFRVGGLRTLARTSPGPLLLQPA